MTVRTRPSTFSVIELSDGDRPDRWVDFVVGSFSRTVLFLLVFGTIGFLGLTFSSSAMANAFTPHTGPVYIEQRMAFFLAALITGGACAALGRRLNRAWSSARLPIGGGMRLAHAGIILTHQAALDGEVRIPWENISAIALDAGTNHDSRRRQRRFPVPSPNPERNFLYDTDTEGPLDFVLVASRPAAPNVALVLTEPLAVSNPNADVIATAFAETAGVVPARPAEGVSVVVGLFLRAKDLETARSLLLPSGKLRALREGDVR